MGSCKNKNNNTKLLSSKLELSQEEKVHFSILPTEKSSREDALCFQGPASGSLVLNGSGQLTFPCNQNLCALGTAVTPTIATS